MAERRSLIVTVAIGLVVATAVVNIALLGELITRPVARYVPESGMAGVVESVLMLVDSGPVFVAVMLPVAGMMSVVTRPAPTPVARWSLLAGAVVSFSTNLVWNLYLLTSGSSTAGLGFMISTPVLLGVAALTAVPIAISVTRAREEGRLA